GSHARGLPAPDAISRALPPPVCVRSRLSMYRHIPGHRPMRYERRALSSERISLLRLEERVGIPRQSGSLPPAFQEKPLCVPYPDPLDERAGKTLRLTVYPPPDRRQTSRSFPVTSRHYVWRSRSMPKSLSGSTSVLPLGNPRSAATLLPPAYGPRYQRRIHTIWPVFLFRHKAARRETGASDTLRRTGARVLHARPVCRKPASTSIDW